nr:EOG090X0KP6 [Leptodora kindtii]
MANSTVPKKSIFALDSDDEQESDNSQRETLLVMNPGDAVDLVANRSGQDLTIPSEEGSKSEENNQPVTLTASQKAKIERNRQKALLLRQARLQAHPYNCTGNVEHSVIRIHESKLIDTGGGFLLEEKDLQEQQLKEVPKHVDIHKITFTQDPAPIVEPDRPTCEECRDKFHDSFLYRSYSHPVCDSCRDDGDKHSLITRTDARKEYLLKDCDLDLREPILRFTLRKNPHNVRWGEMKLYLRLQVEKRAMEVWGSEEELENQHLIRDGKREKSKVNKFNKQVKALRMSVRSSVYRKQTENHVHDMGSEEYDANEDMYFRVCRTCEYRQTYEKM